MLQASCTPHASPNSVYKQRHRHCGGKRPRIKEGSLQRERRLNVAPLQRSVCHNRSPLCRTGVSVGRPATPRHAGAPGVTSGSAAPAELYNNNTRLRRFDPTRAPGSVVRILGTGPAPPSQPVVDAAGRGSRDADRRQHPLGSLAELPVKIGRGDAWRESPWDLGRVGLEPTTNALKGRCSTD